MENHEILWNTLELGLDGIRPSIQNTLVCRYIIGKNKKNVGSVIRMEWSNSVVPRVGARGGLAMIGLYAEWMLSEEESYAAGLL